MTRDETILKQIKAVFLRGCLPLTLQNEGILAGKCQGKPSPNTHGILPPALPFP